MTAIATIPPRNTALTEANDKAILNALRDSFYPGAREDSILMVLNYCRAANLDPMTRPVHIVPMSVKKPGTREYEWRDVVMPGIEFYRTKADRTGRYAGQDDAEFGPEVTNAQWGITYPQWCKVTVYKITEVGRVAYSAKVFWLESYATQGKDSSAPNAMWRKRPFGQIEKCAEAAALRKAFPEVGGQPTADEMAGKTMDGHQDIIDITPEQPALLANASRTEAVKAKLAARSAPPPAPAVETGPDLATTLKIIEDAYTVDEMDQAAAIAKQLTSASDKATARKAFAERKAVIKAEAEAEAKAERAAIQADNDPAQQTNAEWIADFSEEVKHG